MELSPSSPEVQTRQAPSPPQPQEVPMPEEISADVLEQTADPVGSIISSVGSSIQTSTALPQGKVLSIRLFADGFFSTCNTHFVLADIVSSATRADQPVVPSASASQRREIALKQVSHLIYILYITYIQSSNNLFHFFLQEQDSPDSLFSFAIEISDDEGEEASSTQAVGISSAEIRAKLEDLLALLHQDTAQLVNDSNPAKALFKALRGQIPADAEETLFQAAHMESRQLQYQKAAQRLADRATHA